MIKKISAVLFFFLFFSCTNKNIVKKITIDNNFLDSIQKHSDTSFTKKYRTDDFASATYFINKKDSTICQIMKNKENVITQLFITKKNIKTKELNFYNNGQLIADIRFDTNGKKTDTAIYYFENGEMQRTGNYKDGFPIGLWKEYTNTGKLDKTLDYSNTMKQ